MIDTKNKVAQLGTSQSISVDNLMKHFTSKKALENVKAVNGVSFRVNDGEFFGLLGPNGAGKTTTINMLTGNSKPTGGSAVVGEYDINTHLDKIKSVIGVCPQDPAVYKFLSGLENIEFFGQLHMMNKNIIRHRAEELLDMLGIEEARKRKTKGYSGGMLRKLSLIIAIIHDPSIIFLDEPTVGMDPRARRKVWEFLKTFKDQKKTVILTTHYIEEAETLCDRVAIIDYGKVIAIGNPKELIEEYGVTNLEEVFLKITGRRIREEI